ncbi:MULTISPECIES: DUF5058 family protein [Leucobacter]|uniref:DUF5058 family protein n=1 Tax=Leucobacter chromiireducens subsp. chromiireducens TaxID=660067 RepID=A0ABS1SQ55_9MICO|nr:MULTISPECIES: DUF5058 family protein [Leucobacter]MBL3690307.1 DUF5058 family protein [Leucobacter chromiireducens subsp. chromiireducens]
MPTAAPYRFADPGSTDIWAIANSPILWVFALGVFGVIFVQTFLYIRAARTAAAGIDMPLKEIRESYRAGAVASIGPSLAVVLVAIALLALFGTPAVLVRIGLIGSAATETASAGIAATSMGAELGADSYTQQVFAVAFMAMSLSGGMWMLCTLLLTPILKRGSQTLGKRNPAVMALIPAAALLGAFSMLAVAETGKSSLHLLLVLISAGVMALCLLIAKLLQLKWLKEWALGFSILVALFVAFLLHTPVAA